MAALRRLTRRKQRHLGLDGVMMGRAAYQEPWRLIDVDPMIFQCAARSLLRPGRSRLRSFRISSASCKKACDCTPSRAIVLGLFRAVPGARAFSRHLATQAVKADAGSDVLADALALVLDRQSVDLAHIAA